MSGGAGPWPVALALAAAFLFGLGIQLTRPGLRHTDSRTAALIQIGTACAVYWLASPAFLQRWYWLEPAIALLAAIGLFRPFISANLALAGTRWLGPTVSATLSSTAPLFGLALGVLVLGEALSVEVAAGTLAVMAGVAVLSSRGRMQRDWPVWALLLPVGAAFLRVLAQMLAKIGMESIPSPFFVGLVGYSVSFALALATQRGRQDAGPVRSPGLPWLMLAGLCYALAILALNSALVCGDLVAVSPIVACQPFFSLLLGRLLFRETGIDTRVVLGVALVVPGVVLVSLR